MKWFQHDSNASTDAKIRKLLLRHGPEGYAVYFHCLELIASSVEKTNITFELEHDTEIIADNLKFKGSTNVSAIDKVNNIMKTIIDLKLFELSNNKITCFKLALRLDNTISRSADINQIKKNVSTTKLLRSDNEAEENRIDKSTLDKIKVNKNTKTKNITSSKSITIPIVLNNNVFKDKWKEWDLYRKKAKWKWDFDMAQKQVNWLEKFGSDIACEIMEQSMMNGWQGLFELKSKHKEDKDIGFQHASIEDGQAEYYKALAKGDIRE